MQTFLIKATRYQGLSGNDLNHVQSMHSAAISASKQADKSNSGFDHASASGAHMRAAAVHKEYVPQSRDRIAMHLGEARYHAKAAGIKMPKMGISKALSYLSNTHQETGMQTFLIKADTKGEGSRGGKIISHTRSGKPIYGSGHASYSKIAHGDSGAHSGAQNAEHIESSKHHVGWSTADHYDAGQAHQMHAPNGSKSKAIAAAHNLAGDFLSDHKPHHTNKSQAADVLQDYLSKAKKLNTYSVLGKVSHKGLHMPVFSNTHPAYASAHFQPKASQSSVADKASATVRMKSVMRHYPNFTADHHRQAAEIHLNNSKSMGGSARSDIIANTHKAVASHIEKINSRMGKSLSKAESKGEGSRGGKISGHTKSGKPIYAVSHVRHELMNTKNFNKQGHYLAMTHRKYSAQDHVDASNHYDKLRDAEPNGKERLHLHHISLGHHNAGMIKESGEVDAIRNTMKPGSKPATADHWAAANHFNKKFSSDAARHEIDKTLKSQAADVLQGYLSKSQPNMYHLHPDHIAGKLSDGTSIHRAHSPAYSSKVFSTFNSSPTQRGKAAQTRIIKQTIESFPHYTSAHHEAAAAHHAHQSSVSGSVFGAKNHNIMHGHSLAARHLKALGKSLSKAESKGEGSRGGKIVGHTKSGNPIYSHESAQYAGVSHNELHGVKNGRALHAAFPDYSAQDHLDAANHHFDMDVTHRIGKNKKMANIHQNLEFAHSHASRLAANAAKKSQAADVLQDGLSKSDTLQIHFHTMWAPKEAYTPSVVVN